MSELRIVGRCVRSPIGCWSARHRCFQARYEQVLSIALEVFGSRLKAQRWLVRSVVGVGRQAPCRVLCTPMGFTIIHDEIMRLDHGIRV
ncbi:antitoxin Xre/MbcA/ParS toxin-binding domain-containing protein [Pseudomonas sp. 2957]|jgi:putative toxin-antitoxin system antitoxin component (TIGR02293 family)|uniref:antitoxin Xre/MbcA/ParS toxin-binding domain-containing protein n=1 Tax=Pseudomonas sp. 2957 TaxID=2817766 RepID=UPI0038F5DD6C